MTPFAGDDNLRASSNNATKTATKIAIFSVSKRGPYTRSMVTDCSTMSLTGLSWRPRGAIAKS